VKGLLAELEKTRVFLKNPAQWVFFYICPKERVF
jgi:hypothetical protein